MTKETPRQDDESKPAREPEASAKSGPAFAKPEDPMVDLSREIVKVLPRSAGETVTCRRVSGNHYRCNWWAPQHSGTLDNPAIAGLAVTTHRVSRSQYLRVTQTAGRLAFHPDPGAAA